MSTTTGSGTYNSQDTSVAVNNQSSPLLKPTQNKSYGDRFNISLSPTPVSYKDSGLTGVPDSPVYAAQETPKPTSVVGTGNAVNQVDQINKTITDQSNTNASYAQTPSPYNDIRDPITGLLMNPPGAKYDRNTGALLNQGTPTTPTPTPEEKIANAPEPGMQEAYNLKTGQREDQPSGTLSPGYSTQNPNYRNDVSDVATDTNGVQYKQFSDGTYGRFDSSGNYSPATAASFQAAKDAQGISDKIKSIINGTFQLPPNQQAQLQGLSDKYAALIQQTQTNYENAKQGTIARSFLGGTAGSSIADSAVTTVVNAGIAKVKELQNALALGLSQMQDAFYKDDMAMLKDTYDSYQNNQANLQQEIDKTSAYVQAQQDKEDAKFQAYSDKMEAQYPGALSGGETTRQEVDTALQKDPRYIRDQQRKDVLLQSSIAKLQSASLTLTPTEVSTWADQVAQDPTLLSRFGYGSSPNKEAVLSAVAEGIASGKYPNLSSNKIDLKYAENTTTQNTLKYLGSLVGTADKPGNLDELVRVSNNIDRTTFPPINSVEFWALKNSGDPNVAAYAATITEVADQVAKILQGGGTGSGTSDAKLKQAQDLFNKNYTKSQIIAVAHELHTLLQNRRDSLVGSNPFLQQYSSTAPSSGTGSSGSGSSSSGSFADTW